MLGVITSGSRTTAHSETLSLLGVLLIRSGGEEDAREPHPDASAGSDAGGEGGGVTFPPGVISAALSLIRSERLSGATGGDGGKLSEVRRRVSGGASRSMTTWTFSLSPATFSSANSGRRDMSECLGELLSEVLVFLRPVVSK